MFFAYTVGRDEIQRQVSADRFKYWSESHIQVSSSSKMLDCICNKPEKGNGNDHWLSTDALGSLSSDIGLSWLIADTGQRRAHRVC